jgi:hypothetical protein
MTDAVSLLRAAAHPMNTTGIERLAPTLMCRSERCEFRINIGVFFDGTGNNQNWSGPEFTGGTQLQRKKDSNVARLARAYPDDKDNGFYPYYVPGVGTPFPGVGEDLARDKAGMGFGAGGDARIVFGLLQILNAMYRSLSNDNRSMFSAETVKALCSNGWLPIQTGSEGSPNRLSQAAQGALDKVGMKDKGGLLTVNGTSLRPEFLKGQFALLEQ